jgi:hypothetical protein
MAEPGLEAQLPCSPFRHRPEEGEHKGADEEQLAHRIFVADMGAEDQATGREDRKFECSGNAFWETVACKSEGCKGEPPDPVRPVQRPGAPWPLSAIFLSFMLPSSIY